MPPARAAIARDFSFRSRCFSLQPPSRSTAAARAQRLTLRRSTRSRSLVWPRRRLAATACAQEHRSCLEGLEAASPFSRDSARAALAWTSSSQPCLPGLLLRSLAKMASLSRRASRMAAERRSPHARLRGHSRACFRERRLTARGTRGLLLGTLRKAAGQTRGLRAVLGTPGRERHSAPRGMQSSREPCGSARDSSSLWSCASARILQHTCASVARVSEFSKRSRTSRLRRGALLRLEHVRLTCRALQTCQPQPWRCLPQLRLHVPQPQPNHRRRASNAASEAVSSSRAARVAARQTLTASELGLQRSVRVLQLHARGLLSDAVRLLARNASLACDRLSATSAAAVRAAAASVVVRRLRNRWQWRYWSGAARASSVARRGGGGALGASTSARPTASSLALEVCCIFPRQTLQPSAPPRALPRVQYLRRARARSPISLRAAACCSRRGALGPTRAPR